VARIFVGVTPGFVDKDLTAESVRDNIAAIRDESGYEVPTNLNEQIMSVIKALA
jgi:hypothetical protein